MLSKLLLISIKSFKNRRLSIGLTLLSIVISVTLLLGVQYLRTETRTAFVNTISGTDLIVGARSGQVNLLLYSVFRIGDATNNISWKSYQALAADKHVKWTIPISLGDSHHGFRVVGTNADYFKYYRFGHKQNLSIAKGKVFKGVYDAVIGADVAKELGYDLGKEIVLSHGISKISFSLHKNKPFRVVGILARTGTPVDRSIHVRLEGITAIHVGWQSGRYNASQDQVLSEAALQPKEITAFLVGFKSKFAIFKVQRAINNYHYEPLMGILPGATLADFWHVMQGFEQVLMVISAFVVLAGLAGLLTALLASMNERRREMAILRSVGATPGHIALLYGFESLVVSVAGCLLSLGLLYGVLFAFQPLIQSWLGLFLEVRAPLPFEWALLGVVVATSVLLSLLPAGLAYKQTVADGMTVKV